MAQKAGPITIRSFGSSQGLRLELVESIASLGRVDSENHALSAVREGDFLSAVKPEGILGIGDYEGPGNKIVACSNEFEPGVESMVEVGARVVEGRFSDGMVL